MDFGPSTHTTSRYASTALQCPVNPTWKNAPSTLLLSDHQNMKNTVLDSDSRQSPVYKVNVLTLIQILNLYSLQALTGIL